MRKYKIIIVLVIVVFVSGPSCKKNKEVRGTSSLTIVNAVVGSNTFVTNFSDSYQMQNYYANARQINYGSYDNNNQFSSYSGTTSLKLYQMPDTAEHSAPFYNLKLDLPIGTMCTLYLTGTLSIHDTLITKDYPPYYPPSDSSVGVRFINLSPDSSLINVTLSTSASVNEFSNISYKQTTDYKSYPAIKAVSSYTFQFRNAATNSVITSFTMSGINNGTGTNNSTNKFRFRNFTLALIGQAGGIGGSAQKILLINNY